MDEMKSGECLKDCCKQAVEQYKQQTTLKEEKERQVQSHAFCWAYAFVISALLIFLWDGHWNPISIMFSLVALMSWWVVITDACQWMHSRKHLKLKVPK